MSDSDELSLLPLQASDIDEEMLGQLLFDIEHAAELLGVQVKARPDAYVAPGSPTLAEAAALLTRGATMAMQLRYRAQGRIWCDTVLRTRSGFRIVRAPGLGGDAVASDPVSTGR